MLLSHAPPIHSPESPPKTRGGTVRTVEDCTDLADTLAAYPAVLPDWRLLSEGARKASVLKRHIGGSSGLGEGAHFRRDTASSARLARGERLEERNFRGEGAELDSVMGRKFGREGLESPEGRPIARRWSRWV
eukprot:552102-Rhodomonas_salina.1